MFAADRREHRTADRRGVRVLGDRGDVGAETVTGIDRIQPTLFAMQVALAATMASYGVRPGAVIGHSHGRGRRRRRRRMRCRCEDGVRVICRRSAAVEPARRCPAPWRRSNCPHEQCSSELASRGIDDVVVAVVASPAVHRDRRRHPDGPRARRGLGAARRDGPRGGRRRGLALAAGRPDPRRPGRGAGRSHPDDADDSVLLGDPGRPARRCRPAMPATGWTTCARWCASPRRCRPPWRTATGSSPSCHRTRC